MVYLFSRISLFLYFRKENFTFLGSLFILLVELIRDISRPISLTVRLYVNLIIGHYLLIGVYLLCESISLNFFFVTFFFLVLEVIIYILQTFIFTRLVYLYMSE